MNLNVVDKETLEDAMKNPDKYPTIRGPPPIPSVIMALTFTCTLGVATADNIQIRTMLIGALGCNLAWGLLTPEYF